MSFVLQSHRGLRTLELGFNNITSQGTQVTPFHRRSSLDPAIHPSTCVCWTRALLTRPFRSAPTHTPSAPSNTTNYAYTPVSGELALGLHKSGVPPPRQQQHWRSRSESTSNGTATTPSTSTIQRFSDSTQQLMLRFNSKL